MHLHCQGRQGWKKEEGEEAVVLDEVAAGVEPEETVIPFTRQEEEQPLTMEEEIEETEQIEKKLTGELAKIFRKYRDMPGRGLKSYRRIFFISIHHLLPDTVYYQF